MGSLLIGQFGKPVRSPEGRAHSQIIVRENVGPAERKDQIHLCSPAADALHLDQLGNDFLIRHLGELPQAHLALEDVASQIFEIGLFLRREAEAVHPRWR